MNGPITLQELDARRDEILEGIVDRSEIWLITLQDGGAFVLGPEPLLNRVLGLYGEDYGWPVHVHANGPISDFVPRPRKHPFIHRENRLIAIAVSRSEYSTIVAEST